MPTASLLKELVAFDRAGVKVFTGLRCLAHGKSIMDMSAAVSGK